MVFTSADFVLFLTGAVILYYMLPKNARWLELLLASCIFYVSADVNALWFILGTTIVTYLISLYIGDQTGQKDNDSKSRKKGSGSLFVVGLLISLGVLMVTKYTGFAFEIVELFRNGAEPFSVPNILIPMGVSFYTFRTVAYLADVYQGKVSPEKNPLKLFLYVSFFPTVVQGPITRYDALAPTLYSGTGATEKQFWFGVQRILWGFFKKLVIADRAGIVVKTISSDVETYGGAYALFYIVIFMFELYADFSGGMDIALGVSELFGIPVVENFKRPFFSKSASEFWKRWHATMGAFFRDYIYIPLGGDGRNAKHPKVIFYRNMFVVWLATGIWHGAGFQFIIWGLLNLLVLLVERILQPITKKWTFTKAKPYMVFQMVKTSVVVSFIMSLLSFSDSKTAFILWKSVFTGGNYQEFFQGGYLTLGLNVRDYVILLIGFLLMFIVGVLQEIGKKNEKGDVEYQTIRERLLKIPYVFRFLLFLGLLVFIILFGIYGVGYEASQFIYNRF